MADNKFQNWYQLQKVTPDDMDTLSRTLYQLAMGALTANPAPCIIHLAGVIPPVASGNVAMPAGIFRFNDIQLPAMDYVTPVFGNADAQTVAVTGNGFIVARYTATEAPITMMASPRAVNPNSPNPPISVAATTNPTGAIVSTTYAFVTTVDPITDCTVCVITSGTISDYGNFLINRAATQAEVDAGTSNAVAVTPKYLNQVKLQDVQDDVPNKKVTIERGDGTPIDFHVSGNTYVNVVSATNVETNNANFYFPPTGNSLATTDNQYPLYSQVKDIAPTGMVAWFMGETAPTGWHICDGTTLMDADINYPNYYQYVKQQFPTVTLADYYAGKKVPIIVNDVDAIIPNLSDGRVIRAVGGTALALGVQQAAQLSQHQHNLGAMGSDGLFYGNVLFGDQPSGTEGSYSPPETGHGWWEIYQANTYSISESVIGVGNDLYSANVALLPIIKTA